MKETAINSVYIIMHYIAESEEELKLSIEREEGYLWEAYFRKDTAEAEAERLNKTSGRSEMNGNVWFDKFEVSERYVY